MIKENTLVQCVTISQQDRVVLEDIKNPFMRVSSIHAKFVNINQHTKVVFRTILSPNIKILMDICVLLMK